MVHSPVDETLSRSSILDHLFAEMAECCAEELLVRSVCAAIAARDVSRVKSLLGSDQKISPSLSSTLLMNAVEINSVPLVDAILELCPLSIDTESERNTPLICAIRGDSLEVAEHLVKRGADVNRCCPLSLAASKPSLSLMQEILHSGALVNLGDDAGESALFHAIRNNMGSSVELLLQNGAMVNVANDSGFTPLHIAASSVLDSYDIVCHLLDFGAIIDSTDSFEATPLVGSLNVLSCLPEKSHSVPSLLVRHGSIVNTSKVTEAVQWCLNNCHDVEFMRLVYDAGMDFRVITFIPNVDHEGCYHCSEIMELLQKWTSQPRSLSALSCIVVRNILREAGCGCSIIGRVEALDIPHLLKSILKLDD